MATTDRHPSRPHGQQPLLVGRNRERAQLRELLDAAINGHGSLVLVSGEAGIGKTTLVDNFVQEAEQQDCLVLSGGCYDLTITPPYGPWTEAIRGFNLKQDSSHMPAWFANPDDLEQIGNQTEFFEEIRSFFVALAGRQPLVIVLEDLHWADRATSDLLRYLARTTTSSPMLVVATYRDDELLDQHPFMETIPLLVREARARRIKLHPWQQADTRTLITERYKLCDQHEDRLAAYLHGLAEGNPFYTLELVHTLIDEGILHRSAGGWDLGDLIGLQVPQLIRQVIEQRLDRLSDDARQALAVAAVIGQQTPFEIWREASGTSDGQLASIVDSALKLHLIDQLPDRSGIEFCHALVRETLYTGLPGPHLLHCHRRIAEELIRQRAPDPDRVAHHFLAAGDERALEWLLRAGLWARQSAAWFTAAERFGQAAKLLEGDETRIEDRAGLMHYIGLILRYAENPKLLAEYMDEAERLALMADSAELLSVIRFQRGVFACHRGEIRHGLTELEGAIAAARCLPASRGIGTAEHRLATVIQSLLPDSDIALESVSTPPAPDPERQTNLDPRVGVLVNWLANAGRYREAQKLGESYVKTITQPLSGGHRDIIRVAVSHGGLARTYTALGRISDASAAFTRVQRGLEAGGDYFASSLFYLDESIAAITYETDDLVRRARLRKRASQAWERALGMSMAASIIDGNPAVEFLDLVEGNWNSIWRFAPQGPHITSILLRAPIFITGGNVARNRGDSAFAWNAVQALHPAGPATEPEDSMFEHTSAGQRLAIDLALDNGDLDLARDWLEAHDRWLAWSEAITGRAEGQLAWARYHLIAGDEQQARRRVEQALEQATDPRQPLALIAAHRFLGHLDVAARRCDDGRDHLNTSLRLAEDCAAPYERALTLLEVVRLRAAEGEIGEAQRCIDEVRLICEPLQAKRALQEVAALEAWLEHQNSPAVLPFDLTAREVEVLQLVTQGLTNAEIGEVLFISPRTVAQHLRSVYNKLGVENRAAAVARWIKLSSD